MHTYEAQILQKCKSIGVWHVSDINTRTMLLDTYPIWVQYFLMRKYRTHIGIGYLLDTDTFPFLKYLGFIDVVRYFPICIQKVSNNFLIFFLKKYPNTSQIHLRYCLWYNYDLDTILLYISLPRKTHLSFQNYIVQKNGDSSPTRACNRAYLLGPSLHCFVHPLFCFQLLTCVLISQPKFLS